MQKTIAYALYILLITGVLLTACEKQVEDVTVEREVEEPREEVEEVKDVEEVEDDSVYEDGTYSETGSYVSPNGAETIGVTLTVENDIVTAVSIRKDATNEKSINFQTLFSNGIAAEVVGKSLDEIGPFTSVNGSSLTPKGFMLALDAIKTDAVQQ